MDGPHSARLYARHIDSYDVADPRLATMVPKVDSWTTLDFHYTYSFLENKNAQVSLSLVNLTKFIGSE